MHDRVGPDLFGGFTDIGIVAQVAVTEGRPIRDERSKARAEIIENGDFMARVKKFTDHDRSDIAGPARDEDLHNAFPLI